MGFGILFIGYFMTLTLNLKGVNVPPDFLGYLLMFYACNKLTPYSNYFKKTNYTLIALSAMSVWLFSSEISMLLFSSQTFVLYKEISFIKIFVNALMHFYLLKALIEISTEVGRVKIASKCKRNIFITLALLTLQAILSNPIFDLGIDEYIISLITPAIEALSPVTETLAPVTSTLVPETGTLVPSTELELVPIEPVTIYNYIKTVAINIVVFLNMIQIFSCYMWICYEGDEDMDYENAKDPLSKLNAKMQKENAEYKAEKINKKSNKKKKK